MINVFRVRSSMDVIANGFTKRNSKQPSGPRRGQISRGGTENEQKISERQQKFWTSYRETKTLQWQWARHVSRKTNTMLEWSQRELTRTRGRLPDRWEKEIMIDRFNWRVQRKAEYNSSEIIMYNINSRGTSL